MITNADKYYRVCKEYYGDKYEFIPSGVYESLEITHLKEVVKEKSDIKEVCFSKYIQNCFFSISMFLKEGETYYIYETTQKPCVLAYKCDMGDFKASQEVRYRVPVIAKYIGKMKIDSYFLHCIKSLYEYCNVGNKFNFEYALEELLNKYDSIYNEIVYKK